VENLGGERRIVCLLRSAERGAVEAQRERKCVLDRVGRLDQVLDRVFEVVALVDHVGEAGHRAAAVLEQLEHHEVELERANRARGEVVVSVLRVVEVESTEAAGHREARDHLLDVRVREVVAEIDETAGVRPCRLREQKGRAPVRNDRGVERRFVGLVLGEEQPAVRKCVVDPAEAVRDPVELTAEVRLAGVIGAIGKPDTERG
jgi:hypothetical protein